MLETGSLALIVRAGAGYNTIDVAAASKRGIYVSNCPGKNAIAVAELAFALMLALDRRVPDNVADLRAGKWNKKEYSKARGVYGRTLGLLGYGNIGQEMARRAHAFGMNDAMIKETTDAVMQRSLNHHQPGAASRARRRLLQSARHRRAADQRREGSDQVDAPVMPFLPCRRGSPSAPYAGLQPRQLHANPGDACGSGAVVPDEFAGEG